MQAHQGTMPTESGNCFSKFLVRIAAYRQVVKKLLRIPEDQAIDTVFDEFVQAIHTSRHLKGR